MSYFIRKKLDNGLFSLLIDFLNFLIAFTITTLKTIKLPSANILMWNRVRDRAN